MNKQPIPPSPPSDKDPNLSEPRINIAKLNNEMASIRYEISLERGKRWILLPKEKPECFPRK